MLKDGSSISDTVIKCTGHVLTYLQNSILLKESRFLWREAHTLSLLCKRGDKQNIKKIVSTKNFEIIAFWR